MADTAIDWGLESGRTANRAPWLDGVIKLALRMGRVIGWDLFSSSPESSNVVSQYLSVGYSMPHPLFSIYFWSSMVRLHSFWQWISMKWDLSGSSRKCPIMLVYLDVHLGFSLCTGEAIGPWRPSWCSTVPDWGEAIWSECSWTSNPSNAVLPGLSSLGGCIQIKPRSGIFTMVSFLWIVVRRNWSWEWLIPTIWIGKHFCSNF